ncbi:ester cyclase [Streptomyces sp. NBC_01463]
MSTEQETRNRAAFDRFHDATNSGDPDNIARTVDEVVAPDVLFHAPLPGDRTGVQAIKEVWTVLLRAFPDIQVAAEDVIAHGDRIVSRQTVTGTHRGEYRGMPPTGRSVRYGEIFILRFEGGRIVEIWGVVDVLTQLRQLGMAHASAA